MIEPGQHVVHRGRLGRVRWTTIVAGGKERALVYFPWGHKEWGAYEQFIDSNQLEEIEGDRKMILDTFGGKATVMSKQVDVYFNEGRLSIEGITFDDALAIVAQLEGTKTALGAGVVAASEELRDVLPPRTIATTRPVTTDPLSVDKEKIARIAAGNPAKPPKEEKAPKTKKKDDPPPPVESAPAVETKAAAAEDDDDIPFPEKPAAVEVEVEEPKTNGKAHTNGAAVEALAKELTEARKLRDVLEFLMDSENLTDPDELKKRCVVLKERVPCLQRVNDLEARIDRTLEVMDMGGDLS